MKKTLLLTILIFIVAAAAANGEVVTRLDGEAAKDFAQRYAPSGGEIVGNVIETEAFGAKRAVIAFYKLEFKAKYDYTEVHGYLYMPRTGDDYDKVLINKFEEEGATPVIESVFFANADNDAAKELVVICSWEQDHYDVSGKLYATYVFDNIAGSKAPEKMKYLKNVSDKVSGGCDCNYRDRRIKADKRFKTAPQVRAGLKKLGYK